MAYIMNEQMLLQEELTNYLKTESVSRYERRLLNKWVSEGHSVYEDPGSRYLCDNGINKPFLERYREERLISQALRGKTKAEKEAFLREYMGYDSEPEIQADIDPDRRIQQLEHEVFFLWEFLQTVQLCDKARKYLDEHREDTSPFEW